MIKNAIYAILVADSTLTATVGTNIHPIIAPQGSSAPFIVITKLFSQPSVIKAAVSPTDIDDIQVDIYAETQEELQTISARVRFLLDQYSGTAATLVINRIIFEGEQDGEFDIGINIFAKSQDYKARIIR